MAYGALLPENVLAVPTHGWVNLHFSLLPAWRGAAPVQHALLAGDETTGATTFRIVRELDAGPVLGTTTEAVRGDDTAGDLLERLATSGAALLAATLDGLEAGRLVPVGQPADGVSYAPRLDVDDARVRWDDPAFAVDRRVRACTPAPGAWTTLAGERLKLGPVTMTGAGRPGPRRVARRQARGASGHRHRRRPARPGAAARQAVHAGARLGPRRTAAGRRPARHVSSHRARATALAVMRAVRERDAYVNLELPRLLRDRGLAARDAAFATELTHGTIRRQGTYDAVLAACLSHPIGRTDPELLDVLRLGCHQLLALGTPPHAAVSTSVALARQARGQGAGRLTNAVLRKVAGRNLDDWLGEVAPDAGSDPDGHLAVVHSHPAWIVRAFRDALGDGPGNQGLADCWRPTTPPRPSRWSPARGWRRWTSSSPPVRRRAAGRRSRRAVRRRPRRARGGTGRAGRGAGRGQPARGAGPRRGSRRGTRRALARPLCRAGRQGRPAGCAGSRARCTGGGQRDRPAPRRAGAAGSRTAARVGRGTHRRRP